MLERGGEIGPNDESGPALIRRAVIVAGRIGEGIDALLEFAQPRYGLSRSRIATSAQSLAKSPMTFAAGSERREVDFVIEDRLEAERDLRPVAVLVRSLLENAWNSPALAPARRLFVVRDDGVGFDMAFADQLFKTFGRVHCDDEFRESASA